MARSRGKTKRPSPAPTAGQTPGARANDPLSALWGLDRTELLILSLILSLTAAAFANSLRGKFLYDDISQVVNNPTLRSLANVPKVFVQSVWQFMSEGARQPLGSYYRPLFNLLLILHYQLFGLAVVGWHAVSVLLHLAATLLVYLLCRQWGLARQTGWAASLLFGLHPIHSESVAWASALPDPLATVFLLAALVLYEWRRLHAATRDRALLLSLGLTFLALLSKEVAVVFPVFLFLREWLGRKPGEPFTVTISRNGQLFYLAVTAFYLLLRYSVLGFISQDEPRSAGVPDGDVWLTIPSALIGYGRLLVFPFPLAAAYDWPAYVTSAGDPRFWGLGLVVLGALLAAARVVRSFAPGRNALLLSIVFLVPVLNLKALNPYRSLLQDRYLYLPSVGFCVMLALALSWLHDFRRRFFWLGLVGVALAYFVLVVRQNRFWRNDYLMARQVIRVAPRNVFFLDYLGSLYFQQRNWREAERLYRLAVEIHPAYYESFVNLGDLYRVQNRYAEAEQAFRRAIELRAPVGQVYANLGAIYATQNRFAEAESTLLTATRMEPGDVDARYNLAWVYDRQGKTALAERAYVQALQVNPAHGDARVNLGALLVRLGRFDEGIKHLEAALLADPSNPSALYELASAHRNSRRYPEAIQALTRLSELEPRHPRVHTDLGLCYEALGQRDRAGLHFQMALKVAPEDPYTDLARRGLERF